jgi:hypothetical protein
LPEILPGQRPVKTMRIQEASRRSCGVLLFTTPAGSGSGEAAGRVAMEGWLERLLVALSGITLILVVAYIVLVQDDHTMQAEVNQRQQFINQSIQLGRVDEALIRVLAANAGKDDTLRELLAQNGISINATTGAPERESAPPASAPAGAQR